MLTDENYKILADALRDIRDILGTYLKPDVYPTEQEWLQRKVSKAEYIARWALNETNETNAPREE